MAWRARCVASIAAWVILLGALAPALSSWLALTSGPAEGAWGAICSSSGAAGHGSPMDSDSGAPAHCAFCLLHAAGAPPPVVPTTAALAPASGTPVPALFLNAPRPLFAWAPLQARAPPLSI